MSETCSIEGQKPGYMCNPKTGKWIKIGGPTFMGLMSKYGSEPAKIEEVQSYTPESFQTIKKLGEGTFGEVYSAKNKITGETVVIKKIPKAKVSRIDVKKEINILNHLKPYCEKYILCYDNFFEDKRYFYIMTEFLGDYITLDEYIEDDAEKDTERLMNIILNLVNGLNEIHKHIVAHNDIKPGNIMVNSTGSDIKYIDFGIGCYENGCNLTGWRGTLPYMAPELFKANTKHTFDDLIKIDIWALGITIYELITGKTPYELWWAHVKDLVTDFDSDIADALKNDEPDENDCYTISNPVNIMLTILFINDFSFPSKYNNINAIDLDAEGFLNDVNIYSFDKYKVNPHFLFASMLNKDPKERHL